MLELVDVRAGYGRTEILHGISLTVPTGKTVAVMGHNGAGKTTLLRAAVGLLPVTKGKILFDGDDITSLRPSARVARGLAYVPQGQQSFGQLTCRENLQVVADTRRNGRQLVTDMLDLFPALVPLLDRRAGLLSGGQQQLLTLARVLARRPVALLADELSLGLAPQVVARLLGAIRAAADDGLAVLLVEQHVRAALRVADRAVVLSRGRVRWSGPAAQARADPALVEQGYLT